MQHRPAEWEVQVGKQEEVSLLLVERQVYFELALPIPAS